VNVISFGLHATDNLQVRFFTNSWDDTYDIKFTATGFGPYMKPLSRRTHKGYVSL